MRAKQEAFRILESALGAASEGVDEAEVALLGGALGLVRFARNQVHPSSQIVEDALAIRLVHRGRSVRTTSSDLSSAGVAAAAQQAKAELERVPESMPPMGPLPALQTYRDVRAWDEETAGMQALERTALAAKAILAAHRSRLVASGLVAVARGGLDASGRSRTYAMANTRGLLAYHASTHVLVDVTMEHEGRRGRGRGGARAVRQLDVEAIVDRAVQRAARGRAIGAVPPGRYVAVLEAEAVAALVRVLGACVGAGELASGAGCLAGRLGRPTIDPRLGIVDDASHPEHLGAPFDDDGVARAPVAIFEAGVAVAPLVSWESSQRLHRPPTGHGVRDAEGRCHERAEHLVVSGGEGSSERLVQSTWAGIWITELDDLELVDPRTLRVAGSTSGGAFAIEGGEVTVPVADLRFELSILDLLSQVEDLSAPRWANGAVVPALKIGDFPLYASA